MGCIGSKERRKSEMRGRVVFTNSCFNAGENGFVQLPLAGPENLDDKRDQQKHSSGIRCSHENITNSVVGADGDKDAMTTEGTENHCLETFPDKVFCEEDSTGSSNKISDNVAVANAVRWDGEHLGSILPEDVWHLVFHDLDSSSDAENFINSSLYLRQLFLSKRHHFLFPKVAPILGAYFRRKFQQQDNTSICEMDQDMLQLNEPNLNSCLTCGRRRNTDWYSHFLSLRLVDKKWAAVIDNVLERTPSHFTFYQEPLLHKRFPNLTYYSFHREENMAQNIIYVRSFLDHFQNSHGAESVAARRSPWLGRHLMLNFQNAEDEYERQADDNHDEMLLYMNVVSTALSKYGHQLWYCSLFFEQVFPTVAQLYGNMRDILQRLPNLRALAFEYYKENESHARLAIAESEIRDLVAEIDAHPLPRISSLVVLSVVDLPHPIFLELLRRNNQLNMLQIDSVHMHHYRDIYSVSLPNVNELLIVLNTETDLRQLKQIKWPVVKLSLDFSHTGFISWNRVFRLIETNWRNTLTDLRMVMPQASYSYDISKLRREGLGLRLNLSGLRRLTMTIGNCFYLDFILPMQDTLERLDIKLTISKARRLNKENLRVMEFRQIIDFIGYFDKMDESNIWTLFPKLKQLNIENGKGPPTEIFRRDVKDFED